MRHILKFISFLGVAALITFGLFYFTKGSDQPIANLLEPNKTYQEILATDIQPKLKPDYEFPTSFQYLNGCYGFAVGHILMDRGQPFDMLEMEKKIEKPREKLWGKEYKNRLAEAYNLELKLDKNPEHLFDLLAAGEAVVLSYQYPLEEEGEWILHAVAAYSFDDQGIWVSETMSGQRKRVPYEKVFTPKGDETQYHFTRVIDNGKVQDK